MSGSKGHNSGEHERCEPIWHDAGLPGGRGGKQGGKQARKEKRKRGMIDATPLIELPSDQRPGMAGMNGNIGMPPA